MTGYSKPVFITALFLLAIAAGGCSSTTSDGKPEPAGSKQQSSEKPSATDAGPDRAHSASKRRDKDVTVKTNARPITLEGEVIDTWCYCSGVMGPGRGPEHEKCAKLCVAGGVSAGILTDDGTVYIAAKHQGYKGCNGLLLPYVAQRVRATGWLAERGGCKVLKISKVELVKSNSSEEPEPTGAEEQ
ncbi:MAG: hypothetical protein KC777_02875 [Cyanobacteria bacterium HKST-UBA02]|nr:hypothetical protein [Cyanobacteria bacterium HKST-UBA02]